MSHISDLAKLLNQSLPTSVGSSRTWFFDTQKGLGSAVAESIEWFRFGIYRRYMYFGGRGK